MNDFAGKTAFVTGGASGIGFAIVEQLLDAGANVAIADIDEQSLSRAGAALQGRPGRVLTVRCDVSDKASVEGGLDAAIAEFGKIHILCNNAGVASMGPLDDISRENLEWCININLWGVLNGIHAILPHMKSHGEACHIVNTASVAGMAGAPMFLPYCAAKFTVVGLSEGLSSELEQSNIAVSVLVPENVKTNIFDSDGTRTTDAAILEAVTSRETFIDAGTVAARVLEGIRNGELYIFTHPHTRAIVEQRHQMLMQAYDKAESSPALNGPG